MKKGAPIMAVKIPSGISTVVNERAISSISKRKKAPAIILAGKSILWSGPTIIRATWGITSPTHPIIPHILTEAAVTTLQQTMIMACNFFILIPMAWASSSPMASILSLHRIASNIMVPIIMGMPMIIMSWLVTEDKLPMSQKTMVCSCPLGSATYLTKDKRAVKKEAMAIPHKTRVSIEVPLKVRLMK